MRSQVAILALAIPLAFIVPLLPFIINGAPHIGDSWIHLRIAEETVHLGRYQFTDYNTQWPLVNLLLAYAIVILNAPPVVATQIVPILSGLTMIPLFVLCRRLGLSSSSALFGIGFLSFNPLYTYFTFSGAVMKETTSYYLVLTFLMITTIKMKKMQGYLVAALTSLGLVLGHHYAAMIVALYLIVLVVYRAFGMLHSESTSLTLLAAVVATYLALFISRNLGICWSIGLWFPSFTTSDVLLLSACIASLSLFGFGEAKDLRCIKTIITAGAFALCVVILRGGILAILTPTNPITLSECRYYLTAGAVSIVGLYFAFKRPEPKSLLVPTAGWLLFAFIYSLTEAGLVIFIKALHYFGILLAIGAAFTAHTIHKRFRFGKLASTLIILFLIYASSFGTIIALKGPGSYSAAEFTAMKQIVPITAGGKLYGDLKSNYLWSYLTSGRSGLAGVTPIVAGLKRGELILVTATNLEIGFLLNYSWAGPRAIFQRIGRHNILVNGPELNLLGIL